MLKKQKNLDRPILLNTKQVHLTRVIQKVSLLIIVQLLQAIPISDR